MARFPVFPTTQYNRVLDVDVWTSHPDWVVGTDTEEECDETTGECLSYYVVTIAIGG